MKRCREPELGRNRRDDPGRFSDREPNAMKATSAGQRRESVVSQAYVKNASAALLDSHNETSITALLSEETPSMKRFNPAPPA